MFIESALEFASLLKGSKERKIDGKFSLVFSTEINLLKRHNKVLMCL
jgi:hypothetical protein